MDTTARVGRWAVPVFGLLALFAAAPTPAFASQVGIGSDYAGHGYENVIDQHTSGRRHAIWHLRPYNSQWATTSISFWHIPSTA